MKKAHETMKFYGTFNDHQKVAALKCLEKHPSQLKDMSKKAHELYPLALLALESRRKKWPYSFMGCFFDSDTERRLCKIFVEHNLIRVPEEGKNVHYKINKCHIDFFLQNKIFVEFHPPIRYGKKKGETVSTYFHERRKILDKNGYENYPLILIDRLSNVESKIGKIRELITLKLNQ